MMRVEGSEPDSLRMVKDQEPAAQPARGWIGRRDLTDVLRLTVVVWALLLVATVGLMFCFDHDALVAADRRYLSVLQGRDVTRDEVATLYDSTLEAFDGDECFRPRERFCLDGNWVMGWLWRRWDQRYGHDEAKPRDPSVVDRVCEGLLCFLSPTAVLHWWTGFTLLFANAHARSLEQMVLVLGSAAAQ